MATDPDIITLSDIQEGKANFCFLETWLNTTSSTVFTPQGTEVLSLAGIASNSQVGQNTADIATLFGLVGGGAVIPIAITVYTSGAGNHVYNGSASAAIIIGRGPGGGGGSGKDNGIFIGWLAGGGGGQGQLVTSFINGPLPASSPYNVGVGGLGAPFSSGLPGSTGGTTTFGAPVVMAAAGGVGGDTFGRGGSGGGAPSGTGDIIAIAGARGGDQTPWDITEDAVTGGRINTMRRGIGGGSGVANGKGGDGDDVINYLGGAVVNSGSPTDGDDGFIYVLEF